MLVVHMGELIGGFGDGGSWCRSVAWSTCFFGWKNMKCCRSNIEVSIYSFVPENSSSKVSVSVTLGLVSAITSCFIL